MPLSKVGATTSARKASPVEILNIGTHGMWVEVKGHEYLLPFSEHPYFAEARISELLNVQLLHDIHLHWPALDVDLHIDSLAHP